MFCHVIYLLCTRDHDCKVIIIQATMTLGERIMAVFKAGFSLLKCYCPSALGFPVVGGIVNLVLKAVLCEHTVCPIDLTLDCNCA